VSGVLQGVAISRDPLGVIVVAVPVLPQLQLTHFDFAAVVDATATATALVSQTFLIGRE
jgi:hypothetical protein